MGAKSITGKFISGFPYKKLMEESYLAKVRSNYDWYAGDIGTIHTFKEEEAIKKELKYKSEIRKHKFEIEMSWKFKDFMKKHPEYKTKEEVIQAYLMSELQYLDKGESVYLVDYSTPCGYEIVTYGGRKEISVNQLPEKYERYLDRGKKGYTLFSLTHKKAGLSVSIEPCEENINYLTNVIRFDTLNEAENKIKKNIVLYRDIYFLVKNDGTKAYMYYPNIKHVNTTNRKTDNKDYTVKVDEAYPVYYAGMASC